MPFTKPYQFAGGGHCTCSLLRSSRGIPFKPGASVGRGDSPATAMGPIGVDIGLIQGIAVATRKSSETYSVAILEAIAAGFSKLTEVPAGSLLNKCTARKEDGESAESLRGSSTTAAPSASSGKLEEQRLDR